MILFKITLKHDFEIHVCEKRKSYGLDTDLHFQDLLLTKINLIKK